MANRESAKEPHKLSRLDKMLFPEGEGRLSRADFRHVVGQPSYHHCRSTGGHHKHGTVGAYGLIVDIDAYDGVGAYRLFTLRHFVQRGVLSLAQYAFITLGASAHDVSNTGEKVLDDVGTDDGFSSHHAFVFSDGAPFNGRGC